MKLVFLQEPHMPAAITAWNTDDTAESIRDQGGDAQAIVMTSHAKGYTGDVFIFYRTMTLDSLVLMKELQSQGKPCGFMIDDLVWDPRFPFAYRESFESICKRFFKEADFFVFTSEKLKDVAKPLIHPLKPILLREPGILERRFLELVRKSDRSRPLYFPKDKLRILISKGHITDDFKSLIRLMFSELDLFEAHVYYFSVEDLFQDLGPKVDVSRLLPCEFDKYLGEIAKIAPDLILCPLAQTEFNDCKCYPKYLEAGGLGAALLTSDVYPYRKVIEQGANGILAENNSELASLLLFASKNRSWLSGVGLNARADVQANHLLGPIALEFYQRLKEKYGTRES